MSRFRIIEGYKLDRWLFQAAMYLIFGWLWFVAFSYNYSLDYYECVSGNEYFDSMEVCKNPFYKPENAWKAHEFLPPGEYGTKPGVLFGSVSWMPVLLLGLAALINHFWHNRGRNNSEQ